jgi:hypothetical protein
VSVLAAALGAALLLAAGVACEDCFRQALTPNASTAPKQIESS